MIRLPASALAVTAVLIAVTSSPLSALASEGLAFAQPAVSKRVSAAVPVMRITGRSVWYKPARFAWNWGHNPNVILGVAY
jgi:hypothetical protein